jgi:hypothetical protein
LDKSIQRHRLDLSLLAPALNAPGDVLEKLVLSDCNLLNEDLNILVDVLLDNQSIVELNLNGNHKLDDGSIVYLAEQLPRMTHLETFKLLKLKYRSSLGFLKALEKSISNKTGLKYLLIHYWRHVGTTQKIQHMVNLNRGGRRIMRDRHFPVALFPFVIEKAYFTRYSCPMT